MELKDSQAPTEEVCGKELNSLSHHKEPIPAHVSVALSSFSQVHKTADTLGFTNIINGSHVLTLFKLFAFGTTHQGLKESFMATNIFNLFSTYKNCWK